MAQPRISKAVFERDLPALRDELLDLQSQLHASQACSIALIIAGTPAAGRSETVNQLLEWLDPKHIGVHALSEPDKVDRQRPPLWRYWQKLPARGRMTFFFAGWYSEYLGEVIKDLPRSKHRYERSVERILRLENMLVSDGVRVVKIYLHTDKETQRRRIAKLRADKLTSWRVTKEDRWQAKHFDTVERVTRACLEATDHAAAPWCLVDGTDEQYRLLTVGKILRDQIRVGLQRHKPKASDSRDKATRSAPLHIVQPNRAVDDDEYERQLQALQGRLARLVGKSRFARHGLVLAFEGMDAAGKGGAIRRVTHALDARQYQVVPVSAPTPEELSYPYLWRFWRHIPARGSIAIFDRSWYGRVLVERVRGFAAAPDWKRAYAEIVEFERQLTEHGVYVAKFWLSVSKQEQLHRFKSRDEDPLKRFKVDKEDWANRRFYDAYQQAAAEMVRRTDAEHAKWTLVAADDKKQARLTVLTALCETLER